MSLIAKVLNQISESIVDVLKIQNKILNMCYDSKTNKLNDLPIEKFGLEIYKAQRHDLYNYYDEVPANNVVQTPIEINLNLSNLCASQDTLSTKNFIKILTAVAHGNKFPDNIYVYELGGKYVILNGHHRLIASYLLGSPKYPVILLSK